MTGKGCDMKLFKKRCLAMIMTIAIAISVIMIPSFDSEATTGGIIPDSPTLESSVYDTTYVPFIYQPSSYDNVRINTTLIMPNGLTQERNDEVSTTLDIYVQKIIPYAEGTFTVVFREQYLSSSGSWVNSGVSASVTLKVGAKRSAGWSKTDGNYCYYNSSGYRQRGWQQVGGKWYYLNLFYGYMVKGWQQIENKWYFFNNSGDAAVGWKKVSGKWYYFNKNCSMVTGWKEIGKKWYYFNSKGAMVNKWQQISGKWYYFVSGAMVKGWKHIDGKWYYFQKNGAMVANKTIKIDGKSYTFNKKGAWVK